MRTDDFGGSTDKRVELALRVIRAIRDEVPKSFCIGVKVNTADHMNREGFSDMMRQIELLSREEIDYINLSGGSFEDPQVSRVEFHVPTTTNRQIRVTDSLILIDDVGQKSYRGCNYRPKSANEYP